MKNYVLIGLFLTAVLSVVSSCIFDGTEGINISGKIIDADSQEGIPNLKVKVDGVTQFGFGSRKEVGNGYSDSKGDFKVFFKTIEHPAFYEFFVNWGSSEIYTEGSDYFRERYLDSLSNYNIPLIFELRKIEPLWINLKSIAPFDEGDYVSVYFLSDTMGFLRVKSVENFGIVNLKYGPPAFDDGTRLEWAGANVNSIIYGNILVNEELTIIVKITRNNVESEFNKIIIGQRNTVNEIDINY